MDFNIIFSKYAKYFLKKIYCNQKNIYICKKNNMKRIIYLLELGLFLLSINLFSQAYVINTNYCIVTNNAYLIVNGYVSNQSSGNLYLTGTNSNVIVQNNITNDGTINSSGIIDLYGDWINNATYTHNNTSYVYLKGANQNVGGSVSTTFYNLYLQGTGVKTLGNNQFVDGTLNLQDRELATQNYTMTVNNPLITSVQRTTGFVSSTVGGGLARATNSTSVYLFPVGVSGKYRPADITPSATTASVYKVRMANGDATSEGYNRNNKATDICEVNPSFFHIMQQTSGSANNATIKVYYDNSLDGSWDKVGYWNGSLWNNYTGSSTTSSTPLYYGTANNVSLSSSTPIALTKNSPTLIVSASPSSICSGSTTTLSVSGASTYSWTDGTNNYSGNNINVSPTSTTTYTVTGTSGTCTSTATVTVTVNPSPTVSASASPSSICSGSSTTLTASGASTYSWSTGGNGTSIIVTPSSTTTYTVTGTSGTCTSTATVTVTVNPTPTVSVSATPSTICPGDNSSLTATGATTYSWTDGTNNYSGNNINVSPTSTTTYTVTGTSGTCSATATVTVTVNSFITITASATPSSICSGNSTTLTANGGSTYSWTDGINNYSGNNIIVSPTNTTTYTVTGSTGSCSNTASIIVNVNPTPIVTITANPPTICSGNSSILTASGASTYNWSNGLGTGSSKTVTPASTITYTVTGTSGTCSATATITVNVNPTPTVTASATPSSICSGSNTILTANGASTYTWTDGTNNYSGNNINVSPTTNTTYTVTGMSGACSATATINVTVNPIPILTASATPSSICSGSNTILTANGASTYTWTDGTNNYSGNNINVSPTTNTTYTVTGSNGQCTATITVSVTVNPLPSITASATPNIICNGESSVLSVSGANTYSWSHSLGSGSSVSVTPTSTTTYTVTGSDGQCTASTAITVTVNNSASATINPVGNLCDNQLLVILTAATPGGIWSGTGITNANTGAFSPANVGAGNYTITYMISGQCGDTAIINITVHPSPVAIAHATDETCFNGNDGQAWVEVTDGTPPYTYLWNTFHTISNLNNLAPGTYYVTVTDVYNCSDRDTVTIKPGTGDCYQTHIYVPNIFAPDGSGNPENEFLRVYGKGIEIIDFKIFDRWGNKVFQTTDINVGWDGTYKGKPALAGDYTYVLNVTYYNGKTENLSGHIYLLR